MLPTNRTKDQFNFESLEIGGRFRPRDSESLEIGYSNSESLEIEYSSCSSRRLSRCYASTMGVPMCEVCEKTGASYGAEMGAKRRWCAPCGKKKGGVCVVSSSAPMCEVCEKMGPSYGVDARRCWASA